MDALGLTCVKCGTPDVEQHHHRGEEGKPLGKGVGGTHEHVETVPLCRPCHTGPDGVHSRRWLLAYDKRTGTVSGRRDGIALFERPISYDDGKDDPRLWTDVHLAVEWADCESAKSLLKERQATIAYIFHQRYGWAKHWYKRCAQLITDETGHHVDSRRVYEGLRLFVAWKDDWETMRQVGATVALAVAEAEEPEQARARAVALKDEGERPMRIAGLIRSNFAQSAKERERHACPECGAEHIIRGLWNR